MSSARISRSANPHPKILDLHRKKLAVIYVRQSSLYQVENHLESQKRQYQLTDRAQHLGWPNARCVVIDEDLGISGAQSFNRPGYQRLVSMVALREVGIVFDLEISRLARNTLDWYQLLELAAAFDVLIALRGTAVWSQSFSAATASGVMEWCARSAQLWPDSASLDTARSRLDEATRIARAW